MFINFKPLKYLSPAEPDCTCRINQKNKDDDDDDDDDDVEVCTVGSCNPFILFSMSSKCVRDHIISRYNSF